jgi:hypothetical protein
MPIDDVAKRIPSVIVSLPSKPASFGQEYTFPEGIENLPSMILGGWLLKLAAWRGYVIRLLSKIEMDEKVLEEFLQTKIAVQIAKGTEKKITKDQALGRVVLEKEGSELRSELIAKSAQVVSLKRVLEIYTTQFEAISREISRRGIESRLIQQGVQE